MTTSGTIRGLQKITIKINNRRYYMTVYLSGKYTVLTGYSGTGKSSFAKYSTRKSWIVEDSCDAILIGDLTPLIEVCLSDRSSTIILDEQTMSLLDNRICGIMNRSKCRFLFISRKVPKQFSVDYRDIYKVENLKGREFATTPIYKDYTSFRRSNSYICEDNKSGFQYFSNILNNVTPGDGLPNVVKRVGEFESAIVDGAACGAYMSDLVASDNLYAPISFEYLCCKALWRDFEIPDDWWKNFHSREAYCTNYLATHSSQFKFNYSKEKCPPYLLHMKLIPEMKVGTKLQQYADSLFGGDVEEAFNTLKNEYDATSYEEAEDLLKYIKF